jgi:hypothetical protein
LIDQVLSGEIVMSSLKSKEPINSSLTGLIVVMSYPFYDFLYSLFDFKNFRICSLPCSTNRKGQSLGLPSCFTESGDWDFYIYSSLSLFFISFGFWLFFYLRDRKALAKSRQGIPG